MKSTPSLASWAEHTVASSMVLPIHSSISLLGKLAGLDGDLTAVAKLYGLFEWL